MSNSPARFAKLAPVSMGACAAALFTGQINGGASNDAARELLTKYLEKGQKVALRSIVEQSHHMRPSRSVQLKIEQDSFGRRKTTVLQPLSMQGIFSVDDGRKFMNYHPDENRLTIQESPSLHAEDPRTRMRLAALNYQFRVEKGPEIAGSRSMVVVAIPRAGDMPVRRYAIEASKSVLLRLEIELSTGERHQVFDTKAITFLNSVPASTFVVKPVAEMRVIELPSPTKIESKEQARAAVGFEPVMPTTLPYGFVARTAELTGKDECPMVAVRITDGLAYATVYQWKGERRDDSKLKWGPGPTRVGEINLRIAGDLPESVRNRILENFRESSRTNGRPPEPRSSGGAFYRSRGGQAQDSASQSPESPSQLGDGDQGSDEVCIDMLVEALSLLSRTQESI